MRQNPFNEAPGFHTGVDVAANTGTPVRATRDGSVATAGVHAEYGMVVVIRHEAGFETLYGHNSRLIVRVGQQVVRGQVIAFSGNTGASTAPHVHYEVRYQGAVIDPVPFLKLTAD
jgi:murein DD-endopeptidase MepM/ murein hydrolase activator NlpD